MKPLKFITRSLPILLLILWSCQPEDEKIVEEDLREQEVENFITDAEVRDIDTHARKGVDIDPASLVTCNEMSYPIIAWWNREVGAVTISNSNDYLVAEISSDDYFLKYTKLLVMVEKTKTWGRRSFTYYKKYLYPVRHGETTQTYSYVIPLEDLSLNDDSKITIAAMAWVSDNPGWSRRTLFGLAEDSENHSKRFWQKWLIDYEISECATSTCEPEGIPLFAAGAGPTFTEFGINDWILDGNVFIISTGETINADLNIDGVNIGRLSVRTNESAPIYIIKFNLQTDDYNFHKAKLYYSSDPPTTGIPCDESYLELNSNEITLDKLSSEEFYLIAYLEVMEKGLLAENNGEDDDEDDDDDDDGDD